MGAETLEALEQQNEQSEVSRRAVEVIGDEAEALRWMGTPVRAPRGMSPF